MKKELISILVTLCITLFVQGQVPYGFNYQGIVRDNNGNLVANRSITVKAQIISTSEPSNIFWEEQHDAETNAFGSFSLVLCGNDQRRTGGAVEEISDIPWITGDLSLQIQVDAGQGMQDLGARPIRSVPYSLVSAASLQKNSSLEIQADGNTQPEDALFIVKRADGYPVFGVYENGVRVYTDTSDTGKGIKGGFAVGGYQTGSKGPAQTYMTVTADSTRIYVNDLPDKGVKGGFAVGGYQPGKGTGPQDYLQVTKDSTRIYVSDNPVKGVKGGFAVGGYQSGGNKGNNASFINLERENYFIGHKSGGAITTGIFNSVMGYESGINISSGEGNAYLGYQSGYLNNTGSGNLFLGYQSGYTNTFGDYNTFLGYQSGFTNSTGTNNTFLGSFTGFQNAGGKYNTFVGDSTGYSNTTGSNNTFLGTKAGLENLTGRDNVFIGNNSGFNNVDGFENVFIGLNSGNSNHSASKNIFIGTSSGYSNTVGWDNIYIGTNAGYNNLDGAGNVFLGYQAGMDNEHGVRNIFIGNNAGVHEQGSNKLYITNYHSDSTNSIIWGDLGNDWGDLANYKLRFNAPVGINMDPGVDRLSIYQEHGTGTISLFGDGDYPDYSAIKLHAGLADRNHHYKISHLTSGGFFLGRQSGEELSTRLMIDDAGNFGINTYPEIKRTFLVYDTAAAFITVRGKGNEYDFSGVRLESVGQQYNRSYNMIHNKNNIFFLLYEDGITLYPRISVDSLGHVGINTDWEKATEVLDVNGNARFRNVGSSTSANDLRITADGTLTTSTSDARMKREIEPLLNSLQKVLRLEGITFSWEDDKSERREAGMVAQDVQEVFPEAVFINSTDGYYGINYSRFPALFVEAIKEQHTLIEEQQNEINELKERLRSIETILSIHRIAE